ncbi:MAG: 4Fe-4S binding protein [Clostridiaceae bacterium]|nr:4Fe-4S binding protein [Clostridiaceae bacterium]
MSSEVYYFSGTGNSLAVAKKIAAATGGTMISIASVAEQESIRPRADRIGIVFPCYLAQLNGIPPVVQEFVKKLRGAEDKYIFAVCTCGGYESVDALPTLKRLRRLLSRQGAELAAEFSIRLPMNNLKYFFFQTHDHDKMFRRSEVKAADISRRVTAGRREKCRLPKTLFNYFMMPMYLLLRNFYVMDLRQKAKELIDSGKRYDELIPLTDRSIFANGKCNGCSMCVKVCPVHNIVLEKGRPVFHNRCEMCMACVEFCPQKAIHHWNIEPGVKYRHPEVTVSDMLEKSGAREG